jgi:hypothetical protein
METGFSLLIAFIFWTMFSFVVWSIFYSLQESTTWQLFQDTNANILCAIFIGGVLTFLIS